MKRARFKEEQIIATVGNHATSRFTRTGSTESVGLAKMTTFMAPSAQVQSPPRRLVPIMFVMHLEAWHDDAHYRNAEPIRG